MIQYPPHIVEEAGQRTDRVIREIIDKLNENDPQITDLDKRLAGLQIPSIADIQQALQLGGTNTINLTGLLGVTAQAQPSATVGTHAQRLTTSAVLGTFWIETDRTVLYAGEPSGSATVWVYVSGAYFATFSNRPTDLGTTDAGFFFWATDRLQLFEWNGTVWKLLLMLPMSDVHSGRYAVGTVNTTGTAVAWVSGATFNTNWAGRPIIITGVRYTVSSVTNSTNLVLTATAGIQLAVAYYAGFFSIDLTAGVQFFETDRQFLYQAADAVGTVTPAGTTINWTSGPAFSPTWVGATITINGVDYTVASVTSAIVLVLTATAGTPGAVAFTVASGRWLWVSGCGYSTQAAIPTDLTSYDLNALWDVTDYYHILKWSGSAFAFQDGEGSGHIVMGNPTVGAPNGGLWGACDGTAYTVLNGNGTTTSITTPNLTGDVFIKGAAGFAAQQAAVRATWEATANTDNESAHTHGAGSLGADAASTGISVAAHSTAADTDVTGAGTRVTTATHSVTDPTHSHSVSGTTAAGSAHQHALSDATAQLKVPSEANGGLPLRISCVFYMRR